MFSDRKWVLSRSTYDAICVFNLNPRVEAYDNVSPLGPGDHIQASALPRLPTSQNAEMSGETW
jgi:hypothetical protein